MRPQILVVDNDAEMLRLLERHLETEGLAVTALASGADARQALEREEFALVLTDLVMDEVDGLALLREACGSDRRTFRSWPSTSWTVPAPPSARPSRASAPKRRSGSASTGGRGTSVSWKT
jgi:DNA-binding NarL/FixJ family response regulator